MPALVFIMYLLYDVTGEEQHLDHYQSQLIATGLYLKDFPSLLRSWLIIDKVRRFF